MLIIIIAACLSGVARTVGRTVNAQLSEQIGSLQSTFYNCAVGLLCSVLALLLTREQLLVTDTASGQIPIWNYAGGFIGVLFVVLSNITAPRISTFSMTLLIFLGQMATGVAIDAVNQQQLGFGKIAGSALILGGLLWKLVMRVDDRGNKSTNTWSQRNS